MFAKCVNRFNLYGDLARLTYRQVYIIINYVYENKTKEMQIKQINNGMQSHPPPETVITISTILFAIEITCQTATQTFYIEK